MIFSQRAVEAAADAICRTFCDHWFGPDGLATKHKMTRDFVNGSHEWKAEAQAALTAALAADGVALQGWQPIDKHDGSSDEVLVSWNGYVAEAYYNAETDTWWQANTSEHDFDAASPIYPSHWMHLPPPSAASEGEERK